MTNGDAGKAVNLAEHPFVTAKRGQTSEAAPAETTVDGYLARDSDSAFWRIYLTSKLESYLRVPEEDILSNVVSDEPMGRNVVTLRPGAAIEAVTPVPAQLQSSFLMGNLVAGQAPGASAPPGAGMASTLVCVGVTVLATIIIIEQTSPPPPPTNGGEPSICLCVE